MSFDFTFALSDINYKKFISDSAELLSDKTLKRLGTIFIELYVEEIEKYLEKDEKERVCKRNVYLQKRKAQGLMTIEQVAVTTNYPKRV